MKYLPAEAFFLICALSGCTWFSLEREVEVKLPPVPEVWAGALLEWTLSWSSGQDRAVKVVHPDSKITVSCRKGFTTIFLLTPVMARLTLKPAGGFLTFQDTGDLVSLEWEDGWLAEVLWRAREAGGCLEALSTPGLQEIFKNKRKEGSPWNFSQEYFLSELTELRLSSLNFRRITEPLNFQFPQGTWTSSDPFEPHLLGQEEITRELPVGISWYFQGERILGVMSDGAGKGVVFGEDAGSTPGRL